MFPHNARRPILDPTTTFCPNGHCPARGPTGQGPIGIPSRKAQRFLCHACHKTVSATTGTVFYRLPTSAETVVIVVPWLAHGCPVQAIVTALGGDERTVAAWGARAGRQGQAVHASLVEPPRDLGQGQAEELRGKKPGGIGWMALAMMIQTRLWLGGEVREQRALPLRRRLSARGRRGAARRPLWVCTAGVGSYIRAMRENFRAPRPTGRGGRPRRCPWRHVCIAPVVQRYERRRVVETERHRVAGTPARVETLRRRSQGGGVSNTADMERLHATCRERLAPLARHTLTLQAGRFLVGTV
jgi:transposase-like protein